MRPEESTADGVPYEDYVVVTVAVTGPRPPDLVVRVEVSGETHAYVRDLDGLAGDADREERREGFEFGPFGHNAIGEVGTTLAGCDESIP